MQGNRASDHIPVTLSLECPSFEATPSKLNSFLAAVYWTLPLWPYIMLDAWECIIVNVMKL
eukprot:4472939-Heterocapsa_arctica.AAC.1